MNQAIEAALSKLDHDNDEHWTALGLPRITSVNQFIDAPVTSEDLKRVSPDFRRVSGNVSTSTDQKDENSGGTSESIIEIKDNDSDNEDSETNQSEDVTDPEMIKKIIKNLDSQISDIDAQVIDLGKKKADLYTQQTAFVDKLHSVKGEGPMDATQRYLDNERKKREIKAQRYRDVKASGIDLKELKSLIDPRSKLDARISQGVIANRKARANVKS